MYRPAKWINAIDVRWWMVAFWLVWCAATTVMLLPVQNLPQVNIWDKAEHAGTFFSLMTLAWLGYRKIFVAWQLAACLIGYGIAIECLQFFIPSRSFSVLDVVANTMGVLPVWWLAARVNPL
jgi:VanZ family protein